MFQTIVNAGTAGIIAKSALNAIKAIPGLNIAGDVLNAIVAGTIVAGLGEGSIFVFEQIYTGQKSIQDIEWVKGILDSKVAVSVTGSLGKIVQEYNAKSQKGKVTAKDLMVIIIKNLKMK